MQPAIVISNASKVSQDLGFDGTRLYMTEINTELSVGKSFPDV